MKKKLEAELISIAHRILKLKNKSELVQLHQESQKLYEKLSVLLFVEENFAGLQPTIGKSEAYEVLETAFEESQEEVGQEAKVAEVTENIESKEETQKIKEEEAVEESESENEEITVDLFEGSVKMNVKGQEQKWILKPGEKFTYGNQKASLTEFSRFVDFDNEKLTVVSDYIQENYGYSVMIPQEYSNQKITIRINKKEDLKTIVQLISEMYNLNFEINEDLKQITFQ